MHADRRTVVRHRSTMKGQCRWPPPPSLRRRRRRRRRCRRCRRCRRRRRHLFVVHRPSFVVRRRCCRHCVLPSSLLWRLTSVESLVVVFLNVMVMSPSLSSSSLPNSERRTPNAERRTGVINTAVVHQLGVIVQHSTVEERLPEHKYTASPSNGRTTSGCNGFALLNRQFSRPYTLSLQLAIPYLF